MKDRPQTKGPFDLQDKGSSPGEDVAISELARLLYFLRRYFWVPILLTALGIGGGYLITKKMTPYYKASTSIIIRSQPPTYLGSKMNNIITDVFDSYLMEGRYLQTQTKIITSRHILTETMRHLPPKTLQKILNWLHIDKKAGISLTPKEEERIVDFLGAAISVEQVQGTRLLVVTAVAKDPEVAADIVNTLSNTYVEQNLKDRLKSTFRAAKWLETQLQSIKQRFDEAEQRLYEYKKEHKIYALSLENRKELLSQIIEERQKKVEELRGREQELRAQLMAFRKLRSAMILNDAAPDFLGNAKIAELRDRYREALAKLETLKTEFMEKHPKVLEQQARVEYLKKALEQEMSIQVKVLEANYQKVRKLLDQALAALRQAEQDAFDLSKIEIQYLKLKRERDETAKLYDLVLSRLKETDLAKEIKTNNVSILDAATPPPAPFKPKMLFNVAIGGLLGLFLGFLLLVILYYLDTTITTEEELTAYLPAPFLGVVPSLEKEGPLVLVSHPRSIASEALRTIRTNIVFRSPDHPIKSFVVSSANPQEGKTLITANLGAALALSGEKIVLVDTDLRRPYLSKLFLKRNPRKGISSYIIGKAELDEIIYETEVEGLYIMPCGPIPPNPAELLQSERFESLVDKLADRFDRIVFDSPPSLLVTDAPLITKNTDGVILVTRHEITTKPALRDLYKLYSGLHLRIIGVIMNDVDPSKWGVGRYYSRYGKGYYYYRYYGYGSDEHDSEQHEDG